MTKTQKWINILIGVIIGIVASAVYIMTAEPTVSWWDCGEYIATTSKLLIGHPPGAPTFQILGRIATLFAGGDVTKMAFCVNCMSAICSGMTIMLLYFSIVRLARKLVAKWGELNTPRFIAVLGTALVGALTYTFSDTFWFSAVEGEVYAMSSFFTALVFWCILKWDEEYEHPKPNVNPNRWIVLIAYLVGLSIGVHLLNLLTLPAIGLIMYYRLNPKATGMGAVLAFAIIAFAFSFFCSPLWMVLIWLFVTTPLLILCSKKGALKSKAEWGVTLSLVVSVALLGFILWGIVPQVVNLAGKFDLFFVNTLHMPFNSGVIFFFLLIAAIIGWGIWYGHKRNKPVFSISAFSLMMLIIGYSTFMTLVIRSNANPTIDENSPEDAVSLLSYLNREQYGSNPLVYGQSYNTRPIKMKDGNPIYYRNEKTKRYEVSDPRKGSIPEYDPRGCMFFPRMWSSEKESNYIDWLRNRYNSNSQSDKENLRLLSRRGNPPTREQNLKFFHTYQLGYMYWRYFMWNFSGRQNDLQGHGDYQNGNFITGFSAIDNPMVGNMKDMPNSLERPGHNKYYLLPLLLGLVGLIFQTKNDSKHSFVVFMLFAMTGLAIAVYLNMYAFQPRERDYAFAASFYAFAMWIGFGVLGIYRLFEMMKSKSVQAVGAALTTLVCVGAVPCVMAKENWHDHDRSNRYTALAIAKNYLDSCEPNAILFTLGDNDTFPLWYAQEVEGYRTDVRVCNLMLLSTSWYVDQMKRKAYESDPLPISMTWEQYRDGTRDVLYLEPANNQFVDLKAVMDYVKSPNFDNVRSLFLVNSRSYPSNGRAIPASFSLPVDKAKVLANGTVAPEDADLVVDKLMWNMKTDNVNALTKAYIVMMDILVNNNWERPIYYASTAGSEAYLGLENYFQLEGFAYRLVPIRSTGETGRINSSRLYHNVMEVFDDHSRLDPVKSPNGAKHDAYPFVWGGFNDPDVYHSEDNTRLAPLIRRLYSRLSEQLLKEGDKQKALEVLVHGNEVLPDYNFPYVTPMSNIYGYTFGCLSYLENFFKIDSAAADKEGMKMANQMWDDQVALFNWYNNCDERTLNYRSEDIKYDFRFLYYMMNNIEYPDNSLAQRYKELKINNVMLNCAKDFQASISAELRKADFNQQNVGSALQELHQLQEIAQMIGDNQTALQIKSIAATQLDMISGVSAELGGMFRRFYNELENPQQPAVENSEEE